MGKVNTFEMDINEFWYLVNLGFNQNAISKYKNVSRSTIASWLKRNNITYTFNRWKDLTNKKFGRLTVLNKIGLNNNYKMVWLCKCECGNEVEVVGYHLTRGDIQSCGCLLKDINVKRGSLKGASKSSDIVIKRIASIYMGMKQRCYNSNNNDYKYYGGKGIKICDEWLNHKTGFNNFYDWAIDHGYQNDLTIDRIDVNNDYKPSNCRWATMKEQSNNKTDNHIILYNNESKTISEVADITNINYGTLITRVNKNANEEDILSDRNLKYVYIEIDGVTKSISEWSKEYNIYEKTLYQRYKKLGWRGIKLLEPVKESNKRRKVK